MRKRLRYSTWSLLLFITLAGFFVGHQWWHSRQRENAIAELKAMRGQIGYRKSDTTLPTWFLKYFYFGNTKFRTATSFYLFPETASSPDEPGFSAKIAGLRHLTHLVSLQLPRNHITDEEVALLQGLTRLRYLRLEGNEITDVGLSSLAELKELTKLRLGANRITNTGLAHLSGLTKLKELYLDRNLDITDAGMKHLATLTKLRLLDVMGTRVSRAGALKLHQSIPSEPLIAGDFEPIPRGRRVARRR